MSEKDFENRIEALNQPIIQQDTNDILASGWNNITDYICKLVISSFQNKKKSSFFIAFDGYIGTDWITIIQELEKSFNQQNIKFRMFNVETCFKSEKETDQLLSPYLGNDPVFGRVYKKNLKSLFDLKKLNSIKTELQELKKFKNLENPQVVICYGIGAAINLLRFYYDFILYADLTRQEALKRHKNWSQLEGKTQSISPKKLYYVDFQVNDSHRDKLLNLIDIYIDGCRVKKPVMISGKLLHKTANSLASWPFRLKPMYEPGPWGGQWLKKIRNLPKEWVNCAWSFEIIAQEQSLLIAINQEIIDFPWTTFFSMQYDKIMGNVSKRRFGGEFPIRYDYLDTMDGGDLSIQVHPTTSYIKKHFNEPYHQGEMYYIVEAKDGVTVNLGLNKKTNPEEFQHAAQLADEKGIAFDYHDYVNNVPSKKHDLLLIPPGTVHGSGEGQVVLEISATTYRYTFKIYDHLRPDLNGIMRPIHIKHAFNVIKWFRRNKWVADHLKQEPKLIRSGDGWKEYLIADRREFFHIVCRTEFEREIEDDTKGKFHILTLVQGETVLLHSLENPERQYQFNYSETIVVPAYFGKYIVINKKENVCKIAKALLR